MITTILWDVDGTLLDFGAAEKAAVISLFSEFGLGACTDQMIARYSEINLRYWERLERKELSKPDILVWRFRDFFAEYGLNPSLAEAFNAKYQLRLGDTIVFRDNSYDLVASLRGHVKQYVVSNGTILAQTKKLKASGLGALMDGVFLSEEVGVEKPDPKFFDCVFSSIEEANKDRIMIVGDSLTSDIQGGVNAGIVTCWYNPSRRPLVSAFASASASASGVGRDAGALLRIDHEISDLHEVYGLLD